MPSKLNLDELLPIQPMRDSFIKFEAYDYAPFTVQTSRESHCLNGIHVLENCLIGFEPEIIRSIGKSKSFSFGVKKLSSN